MIPRGSAFLISLVTGSAFAQTAPPNPEALKTDPAYQAPVTLSVKNEPVSDVIEQIDKQAKIGAEVATSLSDLKVTVFVKAMPAGLLLDKIASVLDCTWHKDSRIEILTMPQDEQIARSAFLDQADRAARAAAEEQAHSLADAAAAAGSFEEFAEGYSKLAIPQSMQIAGPRHMPPGRGPGPLPPSPLPQPMLSAK